MASKVIYIAGAVTGKQNLLDLAAAEAEVRERGFIPLSPRCLPEGLSDRKYAQLCTALINAADGVLLLNNWPSDKAATYAKRYCEFSEKFYHLRLDTLVTALLEK